MWAVSFAELPGGRRYAITRAARPASYADVLAAWQDDAGFRTWFNAQLAAAPYVAFRWETPGVTAATAARPFEFVLLDRPTLDRPTDPEAFAPYFRTAEAGVAVFPNLGGDAILVVPAPVGPASYAHLAAFARTGPAPQQQAFWQAVGRALAQRLDARSVWLNTAGAGVPWLHMRLDQRPKYYGYEPYRRGPLPPPT